MAANKILKVGPQPITALTTDMYALPSLSGGTPADTSAIYAVIRHVRVVNRTAGSLNFAMWLDVTTGNNTGKEVIAGGAVAVPATPNSALTIGGVAVAGAGGIFDWYGMMRMINSDTGKFLTAVGSALGLAITIEGEIGIA